MRLWRSGGRSGVDGRASPVPCEPVPSPTSILKRLLVGRPFRSDRLQHTLLPKRIALPVFASDALSSVAYAPDEILLFEPGVMVTSVPWQLKSLTNRNIERFDATFARGPARGPRGEAHGSSTEDGR